MYSNWSIARILAQPCENASPILAGRAAGFLAGIEASGAPPLHELTPEEARAATGMIIWLTAPGVTHSSAAAFFTERCRAVASKARSALRGGSLELTT